MYRAAALVLLVGCGRTGFEANDRPPSGLGATQLQGDEILEITSAVDTTDLLVDGVLADAFTIAQLTDGTEVALLDTWSTHVPADAIVAVTGTRPLLIVAADTIVVDGVLDGGGKGPLAGPGTQPLIGTPGYHEGSVCDHGGAGGGHATRGGAGGIGMQCTTAMAPGGGAALDGLLVPGSSGGGGATRSCGVPAGGGGGGAIQLSARLSVSIAGMISVGGGGGGGGYECTDNDAGSGGGGGAGGMIVVDAEHVRVSGQLLAYGGGGGAGGNGDAQNGAIGPGSAGGDGREAPGSGGSAPAPNAGIGGTGGGAEPPGAGGSVVHNGGGGGGAAGRVRVIATRADITGTIAP